MTPQDRSAAVPGPEPLLTVSIVSHGHSSALPLLSESLARYEPVDHIQLIITDNVGNDVPETTDVPWHSVEIIRNAHPAGFARNHNAAFKRATGLFFCVLNPDVIFREAVFLQLIRHLDTGKGHIVAPILIDSRGTVQDSYRGLPSPWELVRRRVRLHPVHPAPPAGVLLYPDWIAGTFMLMRREIFSLLGGFDARYRLYFEDVDLCTRARLLGLKILVDTGLRLQHDPHRASRRLGRSLYWHAQGAVRFFASGAYRRARRLESRA